MCGEEYYLNQTSCACIPVNPSGDYFEIVNKLSELDTIEAKQEACENLGLKLVNLEDYIDGETLPIGGYYIYYFQNQPAQLYNFNGLLVSRVNVDTEEETESFYVWNEDGSFNATYDETNVPESIKSYFHSGTTSNNIVTSSTQGLKIEIVSSLPENPDSNTIYIIQ